MRRTGRFPVGRVPSRGGSWCRNDERRQIISAGFSKLAAVNGVFSQYLLDPQKLVVFGDAIRSAERSSLDLAGIRGYGNVCDGGVFCLTRSMANDGCVAVFLGQFHRIQGFGERTDLVHLDEN